MAATAPIIAPYFVSSAPALSLALKFPVADLLFGAVHGHFLHGGFNHLPPIISIWLVA